METSLVVLYTFFLASVYTSPLDDPQCLEIPTVKNAEVSTSVKNKYIKGDLLTYTCHHGFVGRVIFTCDGHRWINTRNSICSRHLGSSLSCILNIFKNNNLIEVRLQISPVKRCPLPEDIKNGRFTLINGTEFVFGSTIKYTCKTGYQMASLANTRTCLTEGWSNHLPECEEISCPSPEVKDNMIVEGLPDYDNTIKFGHRLQFRCDSTSFKLVGPKELECNEHGEWNNQFPRCEEIICELEDINNGVSVVGLPQKNAPIKSGHKLQFYCSQPGMGLKGNTEVTCSSEGYWSNSFPICEEITCKEEELNDVIIVRGYPGVVPPFKPSHSLTFQCIRPQWIMTGEASITCKGDGTWSSPYPICLANRGCGPPPPVEFADLTTLLQHIYRSEDQVEYKCKYLYTISNRPFMTCKQGQWLGQVTCFKPCIVTIEDMEANKITQKHGPKRVMYPPHKDHITFRCENGTPGNINFRQQCNDGNMNLPYCH